MLRSASSLVRVSGAAVRASSHTTRFLSSSVSALRDISTEDLQRPLSVPLPNLPQSKFRLNNGAVHTHIDVLGNGLRVASEDAPGSWCTVGVVVDVGPRYEKPPFRGAAHLLDRLAFKSTRKHQHSVMLQKMEKLGGNFVCTSNKESILYMANVFRNNVAETLDLLAEATLSPAFLPDEIEMQKVLVGYENEDLLMKTDAYAVELLHEAAYGPGNLGIPQICSVEDAHNLSSELLHKFHQSFYIPSRMVLAGAGVEHSTFLRLVEERFGPSVLKPQSINVSPASAGEKAVWRGGMKVHAMEESPTNNALGIPLTQLAIGFKGFGWNDDEIFPSAVLQILLGGGGSFSSGGPGKGMHSRFYQRVLNLHHWIESAIAVNVSYADTGLFYVQGSCKPEDVGSLAAVLLNEVKACSNYIVQEEFDRAKKQLKSSLMMNLESRAILFEDIGRQVLSRNARYSADDMCRRIDALQKQDVMRLLKKMTSAPLAVSAVGNVSALPPYEAFTSFSWK